MHSPAARATAQQLRRKERETSAEVVELGVIYCTKHDTCRCWRTTLTLRKGALSIAYSNVHTSQRGRSIRQLLQSKVCCWSKRRISVRPRSVRPL